jgi:NAD(P)-dependent dehydrogenase (short-subunit alcohol dehydrogenase family)
MSSRLLKEIGMTGRLASKVALITGGASGIGLATARRFVAEGARVFITGRRKEALSAAEKEIGPSVVGIQGDVADLVDLDRLFSRLRNEAGRLDILFANAGIAYHQTLEEMDEASYDATFRTNVKGVAFTVQKSLPLLVEGAAIVLNASMWTIKGVAGFGPLSASKAAVRSFARTWANELKARKIRVNVVSPGPVDTPAIEQATGGRDNALKLLDDLARDIPLGRAAHPDDIAKAVVFLASDDACYVNGSELFVDGGMVQI